MKPQLVVGVRRIEDRPVGPAAERERDLYALAGEIDLHRALVALEGRKHRPGCQQLARLLQRAIAFRAWTGHPASVTGGGDVLQSVFLKRSTHATGTDRQPIP